MYYVFGLVDFNVHGVEQLMNVPVLYRTLTFGMLGTEFALPVLLWFRRTRPYAIALGTLLHLWVIGCMTMPVFGILMIATYVCFLGEEELDTVRAWVRRGVRRLRPGEADGDWGTTKKTFDSSL